MKIKEYEILRYASVNSLQDQIKFRMDMGFQPYGHPYISDIECVQAMVKYEDDSETTFTCGGQVYKIKHNDSLSKNTHNTKTKERKVSDIYYNACDSMDWLNIIKENLLIDGFELLYFGFSREKIDSREFLHTLKMVKYES